MSKKSEPIAEFHALLLARAIEPLHFQKLIAEISYVINDMGGKAIVPGRIGRAEPVLRRHGAQLINEPLDEDRKRGAQKRLEIIAKDRHVSAYFAFDMQSAKLAQNMRKKHSAPVIFICQEPLPMLRVLGLNSNQPNFKKIDHFIVPSLTLSDQLMTKFQIERKRITIVREGFDLEQYLDQSVSHERTVSLASSWGVIENVAEIIIIPQEFESANWRKNLLAFVKEWQSHKRKDLQFVVLGDDDGNGGLSLIRNQIFKSYPHAPIQFVGHCADMEAAIKLSSMLLVLEGNAKMNYPIALLAQALGRYVIMPNIGAAHEFVDTSSSGEILDHNPRLIADAIEAATERSDEIRAAHSQGARSFILRNFSREKMHSSLRGIFENDQIG